VNLGGMNVFDLHSQLLLLLTALMGCKCTCWAVCYFCAARTRHCLRRRLIYMHEANLFFLLLALLLALSGVVLWLVAQWVANRFAGLNHERLDRFPAFFMRAAMASLGLLGVHVLRKPKDDSLSELFGCWFSGWRRGFCSSRIRAIRCCSVLSNPPLRRSPVDSVRLQRGCGAGGSERGGTHRRRLRNLLDCAEEFERSSWCATAARTTPLLWRKRRGIPPFKSSKFQNPGQADRFERRSPGRDGGCGRSLPTRGRGSRRRPSRACCAAGLPTLTPGR